MKIFHLIPSKNFTAQDIAVDPSAYSHKNEAGKSVFRMKKDVISEGIYKHPQLGYTVDARGAKLDGYLDQTLNWLGNGNTIPLPVDHSLKAGDNQGFARGAFIAMGKDEKGNPIRKLFLDCEYVGEKAAELAARNYISPGIVDEEITDSKGNKYKGFVREASLTSIPAIPGQEPFRLVQTFSADGAATEIPINFIETEERHILAFSLDSTPPVKTFAGDAGYSMLRCSDADHAALHNMVPGLHQVPDKDKMAHITQHMMTIKGRPSSFSLQGVDPVETDTDPKIAAEWARIRAKDKKDFAARIDALKARGLDAPTVKTLSNLLDGEASAVKTFAMSESADGGPSVLEHTLTILEGAKFVPLGERTRGQVLKFSQTVETTTDDAESKAAELFEAMLSGALSPAAAERARAGRELNRATHKNGDEN